MRFDRNAAYFVPHTDWYTFEKGVGYIPTEKAPEKDVGKLDRYYRTDPGIHKIKFEIEPIAGHFGKQKGYVWIVYSVERLDEKGETISGSWDIPCRWEAEKQDDGTWKVTDIDEAP